MIPRRYRSNELIGRKCKPVHSIRNGAGIVITPDTVCTIRSAHYGVEVSTEKCPCCGMYCIISRISRDELELIDERSDDE